MFQAGVSKVDMTIFKRDVAMLGYGMYYNVMRGVATPLYARGFAFLSDNAPLFIVNVELCFVTGYLKHGVLQYLRNNHPDIPVTDANLMLLAQHTHSAPGGFAQHFLYNLVQPGFQPDIYNHLTEHIALAVVQAFQNLQHAQIRLGRSRFADELEVAFNRSLESYNRNPEVQPKLKPEQKHLAVDREMKLLVIETPDGQLIGTMNWFGVHTTSVSNDNTLVNADNKGFAAQFFEHWANQSSNPADHKIVMAFNQDATADVTPNFIWDKSKKWMRGKHEDDFESAKFNGMLQFEKAKEILSNDTIAAKRVDGPIRTALKYDDFSNIEAHPDFTNGQSNCKTSPACWGVSFMRGTAEGPGMPPLIGFILNNLYPLVRWYEKNIVSRWSSPEQKAAIHQKYAAQHPKTVVLEGGTGFVFIARYANRLVVPGFIDPIVKYMKYLGKEQVTQQTPWVEQILPLQIATIGSIALIAIPAEITTIGGKRLHDTLLQELAPLGITDVLISPYANAYAGYITTNEEYQVQAYEAGHTLFGQWTLAAYQTRFRDLARELASQKQNDNWGQKPEIRPLEAVWKGFRHDHIQVRVK
jgi:neutral ceramidase